MLLLAHFSLPYQRSSSPLVSPSPLGKTQVEPPVMLLPHRFLGAAVCTNHHLQSGEMFAPDHDSHKASADDRVPDCVCLHCFSELSDVEPNIFLRPFLEVVRSEDTTGPITGLALTSVNKFLSHGLIGKKRMLPVCDLVSRLEWLHVKTKHADEWTQFLNQTFMSRMRKHHFPV